VRKRERWTQEANLPLSGANYHNVKTIVFIGKLDMHYVGLEPTTSHSIHTILQTRGSADLELTALLATIHSDPRSIGLEFSPWFPCTHLVSLQILRIFKGLLYCSVLHQVKKKYREEISKIPLNSFGLSRYC
jgi:hypothetical protein